MAKTDSEAPRTGKLARSAITGLAAARIGMAELSHRTRKRSAQAQTEHEAALGRILFGALGQLRGSALKVSQLLSICLLYTSPSPRDKRQSRMPSSA